MFTGIIQKVGRVRSPGKKLWIDASMGSSLRRGKSVAVNGVCLTIVQKDRKGFQVDLSKETLRLTNLLCLQKGDPVNLEPALRLGDTLDGHLVQGHIDDMAIFLGKKGEMVSLQIPRHLMKYCVLKGILICDGIALTLARVDRRKAQVTLAIIPYTWDNTNLQSRKTGDKINIETDIIAKYLENFQ